MRSVLEQLIQNYLQGVDLEAISDTRFRCLVDLYKDLAKQNQPIQEGQAEDLELQAFLDALSKGEI